MSVESTFIAGQSPADSCPPSSPLCDPRGCNRQRVRCVHCGSVVLQPGAGTLQPFPRRLPAASAGQEERQFDRWWEVRDMFGFDNVGFTNTTGDHVKFLSCADCDRGPIGFHDLNTKHSFVAVDCVSHAS